ncbi:MAG: hypothetical protein SFV22_13790 [Saprospiraceae bacterium]|nr:hypothetical protein [Saprospiraceae bacterium]
MKKRAGSLVADVARFTPLDLDIELLNRCDNYHCNELKPETDRSYKYATKAYLMFSNVLVNEAKTIALVGCAYHDRISNGTKGYWLF